MAGSSNGPPVSRHTGLPQLVYQAELDMPASTEPAMHAHVCGSAFHGPVGHGVDAAFGHWQIPPQSAPPALGSQESLGSSTHCPAPGQGRAAKPPQNTDPLPAWPALPAAPLVPPLDEPPAPERPAVEAAPPPAVETPAPAVFEAPPPAAFASFAVSGPPPHVAPSNDANSALATMHRGVRLQTARSPTRSSVCAASVVMRALREPVRA